MKHREETLLVLCIFASILISHFINCAGRSSIADVTLQVNCTFDADLCNWQQSSNDDFDWTIISGATPTTGTGPVNDHTQGTSSGNYLFIESSAPRKLNEKAKLISPLIDTWNHNIMCFSLWYYAYGSNIGDVRVLLEQAQFKNRSEELWKNSYQGAVWKQTSMTIEPTGPFQIIIEGVVGDGYLGDIAVDDMTITGGQCSNNTSASPSVVG